MAMPVHVSGVRLFLDRLRYRWHRRPGHYRRASVSALGRSPAPAASSFNRALVPRGVAAPTPQVTTEWATSFQSLNGARADERGAAMEAIHRAARSPADRIGRDEPRHAGKHFRSGGHVGSVRWNRRVTTVDSGAEFLTKNSIRVQTLLQQ